LGIPVETTTFLLGGRRLSGANVTSSMGGTKFVLDGAMELNFILVENKFHIVYLIFCGTV
jgi:hypothetical protein